MAKNRILKIFVNSVKMHDNFFKYNELLIKYYRIKMISLLTPSIHETEKFT